ncbi:class F sortase [Streptomyces sp. NPDC015127]|uniref:class F sortase n=1 Tax=Streptomyces sp. NPDC015127 TaxID=3364939 RepID=UPI0036FE1618
MTLTVTVTLVTGIVRGCQFLPPGESTVTMAAGAPATIDLPPLTTRTESPPQPTVRPAARTPETPKPAQAVSKDGKARGVSPASLPPSAAVRLAIPSLTVESPVMGLGLDKHGRLAVPPVDNPKLVGWYSDGPAPGEKGTAVAVGHRDTRTGPAVFVNLNALRPGDKVNVVRKDRRTAVFTVDKVRTYKKEAFPDAEVYGETGRPELRLLTCGGSFDHKKGYSANVVVFAHLTDIRKV